MNGEPKRNARARARVNRVLTGILISCSVLLFGQSGPCWPLGPPSPPNDCHVSIYPYGGTSDGSVDVTLANDSGDEILYRVYEEDSGRFAGEFRYDGAIHLPLSARIEAECESAAGPIAEATFTIVARYTTELHHTSEVFNGWLHHRLSTDGQNGYLLELMPADYENHANRYRWHPGGGDYIKLSLLLPQGSLRDGSVRFVGLEAFEGDQWAGWWQKFYGSRWTEWLPDAIRVVLETLLDRALGGHVPLYFGVVAGEITEFYDKAEALEDFTLGDYEVVPVDLPSPKGDVYKDFCAARIEFALEGMDADIPHFGILVEVNNLRSGYGDEQYFVIDVLAPDSDSDGDAVPDGEDGWDYNPETGHYYRLTAPDLLWVDAEAEAVAAGGHLVTINDAAEEAWLREAFGIRTSGPPLAWIGFTSDGGPDGKWTWVAGDGGYWRKGDPASTSYVNWCPTEPKDRGPAVMGWCEGCGWNDWGSPSTAHGIIERASAP